MLTGAHKVLQTQAFQIHRLLKHFVAGPLARMAAELVGIHLHTARLFYHRLRHLIAQHLEDVSPFVGPPRSRRRKLFWWTSQRQAWTRRSRQGGCLWHSAARRTSVPHKSFPMQSGKPSCRLPKRGLCFIALSTAMRCPATRRWR